jgi:hypothetical protein
MASLVQRGGRVNIRVGGNTQDYATLVPSLPNGEIIQKQQTGNTNPVSTPPMQALFGTDIHPTQRHKHQHWISRQGFYTS